MIDIRLCFAQAILAYPVRSRSVKPESQKLFDWDPAALVLNAAAPRTYLHELCQVLRLGKYPAGRAADHQPNTKDQQHLQGEIAEVNDVGMISEDERRQAQKLVKEAHANDRQEPNALAEQDFGRLY